MAAGNSNEQKTQFKTMNNRTIKKMNKKLHAKLLREQDRLARVYFEKIIADYARLANKLPPIIPPIVLRGIVDKIFREVDLAVRDKILQLFSKKEFETA
jgi:hypothetical protein